jgi:hypothetical protein
MAEPSLSRFGLFNTEASMIHSNCADQDFQVGVWFPFSYAADSDRRYPVLYIPDGEFAFPAAVGLIPTMMGSGEIPEMVVVGISYHGLSNWGEFGILRDQDFCTQAFQSPPHQTRHAQYTRFYTEELFPLIESRYRVLSEQRALFGFSSAGFFTLNMLFTQPGMFRSHIAASCTWGGADEYFLQRAQQYIHTDNPPPVNLYLSVGSLDTEQLPGFHKLVEVLNSAKFPNLRLISQVFDGEGHSAGVIAKTILSGLKAVFKD